jgi:hypothetical protein
MPEITDPPHQRRPPPAPVLPRRVRLGRAQWLGMPLLLLVPLIALTGFFGDTSRRTQVATSGLRVELEHPERQRAGQRREIRIEVWNLSGAPVEEVVVELDPAYMDRFATLSSTPEPRDAYRLVFEGVEPGARHHARIETEAVRAWRSRGRLLVTSSAGDSAALELRTFVFP